MLAELRIDARIPLPEGIMEEAAAIHGILGAMTAFQETITKAGGTISLDRVTPKPRGAKNGAETV